MSNTFTIEATSRDTTGTGAARRGRHAGTIPAIVYGAGEDNVNIALDHNKILNSLQMEAFHSSILELSIDGTKEKVVVRDYQLHPASDVRVIHVDFQRVSRTEKLSLTVPFHFVNEEECKGVKDGGSLSRIETDIDVTCLPGDLPEYIEVDVINLDTGESITLADIVFPEGVESSSVLSGGTTDSPIVMVSAPQAAAPAEDEAATEETATEETATEE